MQCWKPCADDMAKALPSSAVFTIVYCEDSVDELNAVVETLC